MRGTSVTVYLTTLAITDNVFLLNTILHSCSNALSTGSYPIHLPFPYQMAVSYWTGHMNSWIVLALTIDRLLLVYHPLKAAFFCSQKMALKVNRSCMHILTNIVILHRTNNNMCLLSILNHVLFLTLGSCYDLPVLVFCVHPVRGVCSGPVGQSCHQKSCIPVQKRHLPAILPECVDLFVLLYHGIVSRIKESFGMSG